MFSFAEVSLALFSSPLLSSLSHLISIYFGCGGHGCVLSHFKKTDESSKLQPEVCGFKSLLKEVSLNVFFLMFCTGIMLTHTPLWGHGVFSKYCMLTTWGEGSLTKRGSKFSWKKDTIIWAFCEIWYQSHFLLCFILEIFGILLRDKHLFSGAPTLKEASFSQYIICPVWKFKSWTKIWDNCITWLLFFLIH